MKHNAGLDVSVKETSVCITDETGKICHELMVISHLDDLVAVLKDEAWTIERIGFEADPLSQWLFDGLVSVGLPAICIESSICEKQVDGTINLIQTTRQRGGISDVIRGQIGTDDLAAHQIEAEVQLAPGAPFTLGFMLFLRPFALAENLQPGTVHDEMHRFGVPGGGSS